MVFEQVVALTLIGVSVAWFTVRGTVELRRVRRQRLRRWYHCADCERPGAWYVLDYGRYLCSRCRVDREMRIR